MGGTSGRAGFITFVVDGKVCDGADYRPFGWGRFGPNLRHANGSGTLQIGPSLQGEIRALRLYSRHLHISEVIGTWRAGP